MGDLDIVWGDNRETAGPLSAQLLSMSRYVMKSYLRVSGASSEEAEEARERRSVY